MLTLSKHDLEIIKKALLEDLEPNGDITTKFSVEPDLLAEANIIAKEDGILACSHIAQEILDEAKNTLLGFYFDRTGSSDNSRLINGISQKAEISFSLADGEKFKTGQTIAKITGPAQILLATERTLLNFLQRLCGIASYTYKLNKLIKDYETVLLDTRKTTPGLRKLEKEAVKNGGATNHRYNLSDMILIKENHLSFAKKAGCGTQDLESFINGIREKLLSSNIKNPGAIKIECEVAKEEQLEPVIKAGVDIIMLDNFSPDEISTALKKIAEIKSANGITKDLKVEASGGIDEKTIEAYAKTGVDFISIGSLTNRAKNVDLSMIFA